MFVYSRKEFRPKFDITYVTINDKSLTYKADDVEATFLLNSIINYFINDDYIYIRTNTNDQLVIPINCLNSKEDLNLLSQYILKNKNEHLENHYPYDIERVYL